MKNYKKAAKLVIHLSIASLASGCTTLVAYTPKVGEAPQALRYTQGVGTLSEKDDDHEIFIYPKFRTQPTTMPTFTIGYLTATLKAAGSGPAMLMQILARANSHA